MESSRITRVVNKAVWILQCVILGTLLGVITGAICIAANAVQPQSYLAQATILLMWPGIFATPFLPDEVVHGEGGPNFTSFVLIHFLGYSLLVGCARLLRSHRTES